MCSYKGLGGKNQDVVFTALALQRAFLEHQAVLQRLELKPWVTVIQVRTCDGLVIPDGDEVEVSADRKFIFI
jgi:5'-phosphate synthase pdxT subunit